jgi:hypothetical protein
MPRFEAPKLVLAASEGVGQDGGVAKIELPESWAGVAEPLRALMAEVEREAHARQREGTRSGVRVDIM